MRRCYERQFENRSPSSSGPADPDVPCLVLRNPQRRKEQPRTWPCRGYMPNCGVLEIRFGQTTPGSNPRDRRPRDVQDARFANNANSGPPLRSFGSGLRPEPARGHPVLPAPGALKSASRAFENDRTCGCVSSTSTTFEVPEKSFVVMSSRPECARLTRHKRVSSGVRMIVVGRIFQSVLARGRNTLSACVVVHYAGRI
jgi:hypothetical protein